jgi:type I restriction enzyme, S subunit
MTAISYRFLSVDKFQTLNNWSATQAVSNSDIFSKKYKFLRIGDLLKKSKLPILIQDNTNYKRVTIKLHGNGVKVRDTVLGEEIKTKRLFLLKKGQFVYSRIDARNGAFGLAKDDVDNAVITNDFPAFDVNNKLITPEFLSLITGSKPFFDFCQSLSSGTTGRQRMDENSFLSFEIPLPDLPTQNQLVNQYNKNLAKAQKAENHANELEKGIESYLLNELGIDSPKPVERKQGLQFIRLKELSRWGVEFSTIDIENPLYSNKYPTVNFADYILINPKIDFTNLDKNDKITFIPMEVISDEYGQLKEYRTTKIADAKGYTKIGEGDLIWAKINPCMQNGKSAIVKNLTNGFACGSTEFHVFRLQGNSFSLDFIYTLLRSEYLKSVAQKHFTGSAGQQRVPSNFFKNLQIPLPPKEIQTQIVNYITTPKGQIKNLRQQAEKLRKQAKENFEKEIFVTT